MTIAKERPATKDEACRVLTKVVGRVARKYARNHTQDYMDLFQEGMIGVCKAYDKWENGHGASFSTYAYWWILNEVQQAVKKNWKTYNNTSSKHVDEYNHIEGISAISIEQVLVNQRVNKLSEREQGLFRLRKEGMTWQEIADVLDYPSLHRARSDFNKLVEEIVG